MVNSSGPLDVLVVGAGPTGLALAAELTRYGVRFRVVDRQPDRVHESRALAVQPRTLEILAGVGGITDEKPYQLPTSPTPPFTEYVSGHSTFSAAAAGVLRSFTGSDTFGESVTIPANSLPAGSWRTSTSTAPSDVIRRGLPTACPSGVRAGKRLKGVVRSATSAAD
jgi:FAD binding domain-containing protein